MKNIDYIRHEGHICARVRVHLHRTPMYVYLVGDVMVDICLPGDLLSIKDKASPREINTAVARAKKILAEQTQEKVA